MPTTKTDPIDKLITEVTLGRHDDRLHDLSKAVGARLVDQSLTKRWRLAVEVPGHGEVVVDEDSITVGEMLTAEAIAGCSWHALHPLARPGSILRAQALLATHLIHRNDVERSEAMAAVADVATVELVKGYSEYITDADPFPAAGPST